MSGLSSIVSKFPLPSDERPRREYADRIRDMLAGRGNGRAESMPLW